MKAKPSKKQKKRVVKRASYSMELITTLAGSHWRIADPDDNRVATCYLKENAQLVVDALNRQ